MRKRIKNKDISVNAIAGTGVVLLGLNAEEQATKGLLGFHISKQDGKTGQFQPLSDGRDFEGVESKVPVIQAFQWSDYVVDPKTTYTYRVVPVYGDPSVPEEGKLVEVTISTEDPEDETHAVYFNRGVAGSQAYSRRFGDHRKWYKAKDEGVGKGWSEFVKPEDIPNREAYKWLSRGLEEAMLGFIGQAKNSEYAIRAAVYEFTYVPVIQAFVDALERGVDVKIIHHAKRIKQRRLKKNEVVEELIKDSVCQAADAAVKKVGLTNPDYKEAFDQMMIERTITQISHNKFIVLLKKGNPIQVWTGSTNFTEGGIFGQSNVGHVIRNEAVAKKYLEYWDKLSTDPKKKSAKSDPPDEGIQNWTVMKQPDLKGPPSPNSITPVFSPRLTKAMLDWYADQLATAKNSVFFTAAFSIADEILEKVKDEKPVSCGEPYLRYLLLEGKTGLMKPKYPIMAECTQNRIAWGDTLKTQVDGKKINEKFIETLTGLNDHVNYLHTKYMLIDPLSDDPTVITGSANFSKASTINNDENMVIIRGNTRVADIFLGEFMRLFNHFHRRNQLNEKMSDEEREKLLYLIPDDSWTKAYYTEGTQENSERLLFSIVGKNPLWGQYNETG
jgi:phosphatidylserine/phosphatidylglycerophosphate/cardiolipin synthase-like enzyme